MSRQGTPEYEAALARHEAGTGKRRVTRFGRLANPTAADPARGSFTPSGSRRDRRKRTPNPRRT